MLTTTVETISWIPADHAQSSQGTEGLHGFQLTMHSPHKGQKGFTDSSWPCTVLTRDRRASRIPADHAQSSQGTEGLHGFQLTMHSPHKGQKGFTDSSWPCTVLTRDRRASFQNDDTGRPALQTRSRSQYTWKTISLLSAPNCCQLWYLIIIMRLEEQFKLLKTLCSPLTELCFPC